MAFPQRKRTPSFSSTVLDSIYRSIDESDGFQSDITGSISENVSSASSSSSSSSAPPSRNDDKLTTLRRVIMDDEHWLSSRTNTTTTTSSADLERHKAVEKAAFSSYRAKRRSIKLADQGNRSSEASQEIKKTLSKRNNDKNVKAVKLVEELKRPKQPVSPGARLTSFLNSIFQSNAKKVKLCSLGKTTDVKPTSSRSCFSGTRYNTTDSKNKCNNLKTSVRLYPVRVTIDGHCRDSIYNNSTRKTKTMQEFIEKKSVGKITTLKEEIKANIHHTELTCIPRKIGLKNYVTGYRDEDEDEEEDAWSYSSSDLFELDNHWNGMGRRYIKELPVYETTDFKTNQAIARGLLF